VLILKLNADQALQTLMEGNKRYVAAKSLRPNQSAQRRGEVAKDQNPFAVILGCSDSRVPAEVIFDQGLGDLFVIRLAGNVAGNLALGSIEYAVEYLGVPLVMVLGHSRCGANSAAVQVAEKSAPAPGHIASLIEAIWPAVNQVRDRPGDLVDNAITANVALIVERLKSLPPILSEFVQKGKLRIVGARYDLDTGVVEQLVEEAAR
jgi:carbonic anhydrase